MVAKRRSGFDQDGVLIVSLTMKGIYFIERCPKQKRVFQIGNNSTFALKDLDGVYGLPVIYSE